MTTNGNYRATIAIIGGATAGAEAAEKLSEAGALCAVFEQNDRPYGKVEDGLPRWHENLRHKEYTSIDAKLDRPGVHFIPRTGIGRDIGFTELVEDWGFDLVLLANGAWRDRALPVLNADTYVNRGLIYQNTFIYWFNHYEEPGYDGPSYQIADNTMVVGGGLASIDVAKVLQLELVARALWARGIRQDLLAMELDGVPETLKQHGLCWDELGLAGCTLYYRRRIEDMPLADAPPNATPELLIKTGNVRRRILDKAQNKYLFKVEPLWSPVGLLTHGDRLDGLRFARTKVDGNGRAIGLSDEICNVQAPLVISSIGSIPQPIEGLPMDGELLRLEDLDLGSVIGFQNVFGCGNVVTGKGNLVASRRHSALIASRLIERIEAFPSSSTDNGKLSDLTRRIAERQRAVGYEGSYTAWATRVSPPGADFRPV